MKKLSENWWLVLILVFMAFGLVSRCTNLLDGVPEDKQEAARSRILKTFPHFETEVQESIRSKNPTYLGSYGYHYEKTGQENVVIVKYGTQGVDWLGLINPFNNKQTTDIYHAVKVDLTQGTVRPVVCVPSESWGASQQTICK